MPADITIPSAIADRQTVSAPEQIGAVRGPVALILRLEGAAALVAAVLAYGVLGGGWGIFALLFLLPDLSFAGYAVNQRLGAHLYNAAHTYLSPAVLALAGLAFHEPAVWRIALIWAAHVGFDRSLGYGLKYEIAFGATHLGWRGKDRSQEVA